MAKVSVVCLSEHGLRDNNAVLSFPTGYHCSNNYSRTNYIRGDSLVSVHNSYQSRACGLSNFCSEILFKAYATFVDKLNIIAVSIYHSPKTCDGSNY